MNYGGPCCQDTNPGPIEGVLYLKFNTHLLRRRTYQMEGSLMTPFMKDLKKYITFRKNVNRTSREEKGEGQGTLFSSLFFFFHEIQLRRSPIA